VFSDNGPDPDFVGSTNGAAVFSAGARTLISGCTFENNRATSNDDSGTAGGGAVYIEGEFATIEDSSFINNRVSVSGDKNIGHGGAIYIPTPQNKTRSVSINNCRFEENIVEEGSSVVDGQIRSGGGAIQYGIPGLGTPSGEHSFTVSGSTFIKNRSSAIGGAIGAKGEIDIYNSLFSENMAKFTGGAIYLDFPDASITNSTFYNNTAGAGGGAIRSRADEKFAITNSIFWKNVGGNTGSNGFENLGGLNFAGSTKILISHSIIDVRKPMPGQQFTDHNPLFLNTSEEDLDFRLDPSSPAIDRGKKIPWLFSDIRGSVRPVDITNMPRDGNNTIAQDSAFDMGAYEYSEDYGGLEGDLATKAFKEVAAGGSLVVTGFEYEIKWKDKNPFPFDSRIKNPGEYDVTIALVAEAGSRIDLGAHTVEVSQHGYKIPFTFGPEHIGTWRLRVELASDPYQFEVSDEFSIAYKEATRYALSQWIRPPAGADPGVEPDVDDEDACYWSVETNRLYAIKPVTTVITWYGDQEKTEPYPVVAYITYPDPDTYPSDPDTVIHVPIRSEWTSCPMGPPLIRSR